MCMIEKYIDYIEACQPTVAPGAVEGLPLQTSAENIAGEHASSANAQAFILGRQQEDGEYDQTEDGSNDQQSDEYAAPIATLRRYGHQFLQEKKI